MPSIYLPYMTVFGIPLRSLRQIKKAGFHGVEIHLINYRKAGIDRIFRTMARAHDLGLRVNLHQGWSLSENSTLALNHVLNAFGYLPSNGYTLDGHLPLGTGHPAVVYADRFEEAREHPERWLQTCSVFDASGKYKLPYAEFLSVVRANGFGVVFDTQHFLEYSTSVIGVEGLPKSRSTLLDMLKSGWDELGAHVREIHLNDSDPALGHSKGRNVFPGSGILPLKEFMGYVKKTGWYGIITPEVSPFSLIRPHALQKLMAAVKKIIG